MKPEEFDIVNRGNWLTDNKILKDYKFDNKLTIMICSKSKNDENKPDGIIIYFLLTRHLIVENLRCCHSSPIPFRWTTSCYSK
jgi:hypothetical protein